MANPLTSTLEDSVNYLDVENAARESLSIHWRAVFAGAFVSMLTYFVLMSLGLAFGAGPIRDIAQGQENVWTVTTGAGLWLLLTVLISLFVGSYASGRVSGIIATRVGYVQGAVIAAVFFTLLFAQAGITVSILASGFGSLRSALIGTANANGTNPRLMGLVEDALSDLNLRSSAETVATGTLARVLRGDMTSAASYLAAQSGLSRQDAEARLNTLSAQVRTAAGEVAQRASDVARTMGWSSFALMVLGSFSGMLGGALGAQMSLRKPMDLLDRKALRSDRPAFSS